MDSVEFSKGRSPPPRGQTSRKLGERWAGRTTEGQAAGGRPGGLCASSSPAFCGCPAEKLNFRLRNMPVTLDEVRKIASLAGLRLAPEEEAEVAERMAEVVRFAECMAEPVGKAVGGGAAVEGTVREREDVPGECLDPEVVTANAPDRREGFVRLPPIRRGGSSGAAGEGS